MHIFFLFVLFNLFNIISQLSHRTLFMFLNSNFSGIITCIVSCTWCCLLLEELNGFLTVHHELTVH